MSGRPTVVATDAGRTGEGIYLVALLRWLAGHGAPRPDLLLWHGGPLLADLRELADVRVLSDIDRWWLARGLERLGLRRAARPLKSLRLRWWMWRRRRSSALYSASARSARILAWAPKTLDRVVTHVHDADDLAALEAGDRAVVLDRTQRFIAGSGSAESALVAAGIRPDRIRPLGLFTDVAAADGDPRRARAALDLPDRVPVVASTGAADWWSAPDLFPVIAWRLSRALPDLPVHFLWLSDASDRELWPLWHDVRNVGLVDRFRVAAPTSDGSVLGVADVLVVSAAETAPSPSWAAAAAAGTPVVRVAGPEEAPAGEHGHVTVVPYLDLDALVDVVAGHVRDGGVREARERRAAAWEQMEADVDATGMALAAELGLRL